MKKLFDLEQGKRFWKNIKKFFVNRPKNEGAFGKYLKYVSDDTTEWADFPAALVFKGVVSTFNDLPTQAEKGDVYHIESGEQAGAEYFYDGSSWEYVGQLIDATYKPGVGDDAQTIALGGISKGTTAESLKGNTFSKLFDMLLFPTYAPQWVAGYAKFIVENSLVTIYSTPAVYDPTKQIIQYISPKAITASKTVSCTADRKNSSVTCNKKQLDTLDSGKVYGTYTYSGTIKGLQSVEKVVDSKGNPTNKTASNQTTLIADAQVNSNITEDFYIEEHTYPCTLTRYFVYPYYKGEEQLPLTKDAVFTCEVPSSVSTKWTLSFPNIFNVKIIPPDVQGKYEDKNDMITAGTITQTSITKTVNNQSVAYTQYTTTSTEGAKTVQIKLSRK